MRAFYRQNNLDKGVLNLRHKYYDNRFDSDTKLVIANTFLIFNLIDKKQITFKWSF